MVEYPLERSDAGLDEIFYCLSDPTRRDILQRVSEFEMPVAEIAFPYPISLAAVSKHLKILEASNLIVKRRSGKQLFVSASPYALKQAGDFISSFRSFWDNKPDSLSES